MDWRVTPNDWLQIAARVPSWPQYTYGGAAELADDRACFEGMIWRLVNQARWNDIPRALFPSSHACWRRFSYWSALDALDSIWLAFLSTRPVTDRPAWRKLVAEKGFAPIRGRNRPVPRQIPSSGLTIIFTDDGS